MREEGLPEEFTKTLDELAASYLRETDPIRASGFGGGPERWRSEREPILDGIPGDGDLLDVGCANGYLLLCLVRWGRARGLRLVPHGVDRSAALVERAREMLPEFSANMHVGDAWTWTPPRRYACVYALYDCVPVDYLAEYVERLLDRAVADGGRLMVGAYGSRSADQRPFDLVRFLESHGHVVSGHSRGGSPPISLFAWVDRPHAPTDRSTEATLPRAPAGLIREAAGHPGDAMTMAPMQEADIPEVSKLLVSSYGLLSRLEGLSPKQARFLVSERGSEECVRRESRSQDYLVVRDADGILGMVAVSGETITKLYVSPEHQREGIGRSLYEAAESLIRRRGHARVTLGAFPSAVPFYRRMGLSVTGHKDASGALRGLATALMEKELGSRGR